MTVTFSAFHIDGRQKNQEYEREKGNGGRGEDNNKIAGSMWNKFMRQRV